MTTAEVFIRVDPNLKIRDAADIARRTKRALSKHVHDLCSTEVHLGKRRYYRLYTFMYNCTLGQIGHDLDNLDPHLPLQVVVQDLYSTDPTQET